MLEIPIRKRMKNDFADLLDWMLAIDFDSVKIRQIQHISLTKFVRVMDRNVLKTKKDD
jgi:hypothetical protein